MDEPTRQFLADASSIRLTPGEKADFREELARFMAGEEAVAELERDPLIRSFFAEAAGISLTVDETETSRQDLLQFVEEQAVRSQVDERHAKGMENRSAILGNPADISLSEAERTDVRRGLVSFMERTRSAQEEVPPAPPLTLQEYLQDFWRVILPRTAALACAFLVVSTGAAFAAESSVPGDWLYPLKVQVFEQVRGKFIFAPAEKAEWEASRAMRRLEEAEWLAAHDDLTDASWLELHGNFVEHVIEAEYHIDALARSGSAGEAERLAADLDTYLKAHRTVLQAIDSESGDDPDINTALEQVESARQNVSRNRDERSAAGSAEPDAGTNERARATAEADIESALDALAKAGRSAALREESQARAKMKEAEALLDQARNQFGAGLYKEARAVARDAVKAAAEAKLLGRLPRDLPLPAFSNVEKEAPGEQPDGIVDTAPAASDSSRSTGRSSSSSSRAADREASSAAPASSVPAEDDGHTEADIDVSVPGADVKVDVDGLLD